MISLERLFTENSHDNLNLKIELHIIMIINKQKIMLPQYI